MKIEFATDKTCPECKEGNLHGCLIEPAIHNHKPDPIFQCDKCHATMSRSQWKDRKVFLKITGEKKKNGIAVNLYSCSCGYEGIGHFIITHLIKHHGYNKNQTKTELFKTK